MSRSRVWRLADGAQVKGFRDHPGEVVSVALASGGAWVASTGRGAVVRRVTGGGGAQVLDAGPGPLPRFMLKPPLDLASGAVGFAADGEAIWVSPADGEARVWGVGK